MEQMSKKETLAMRGKYIGKSCQLFFRQDPIKILRGEGQYMYDENNEAYLDCINNVAHVGHCHPKVVQAGCEQMKLLSTNNRFLHDNIVVCAKRLIETMPKELTTCFFVNSGSEANDLAIRLAKIHTGNKDIITLEGAYHGHLTSLIDISHYKFSLPGGTGLKEHVNLYGGNPVSCAIANAVMDVIVEEDLMDQAKEVGKYLLEKCLELQDRHVVIGDVRGRGLFIGIELVKDRRDRTPDPEAASFVNSRMKENRVLLSVDGPNHNVIKMKPPMVFTKHNVDEVISKLDRIFKQLEQTNNNSSRSNKISQNGVSDKMKQEPRNRSAFQSNGTKSISVLGF